ncbi:unnamed protein product [Orchesella dallaii]
MGKMEQEPEVETLANIEGVIGLTLTPETKQFFEIDEEEMFQTGHHVHKWLSWKKVKLHIFMNEDRSEFFPYYDTIKYYPDVTMLLGSDPRKETGHDYFICLTVEARNNVLNPPKKKKVALDLKQQQEQIWNEMASKAPRKWRGYGSELEVNDENVIDSRPLLSVQVYRYRQHFGSECKFEDAPKDSPSFKASFKSEPVEQYPCIQTVEVDRAVQVMPQKKETSTQTGFCFKRNKMIQYNTQSITENNVANIMGSKKIAKFFKKVTPRLDKVLQQNEMVDLLHDDYRNLKCKRGHEMEFSTESMLLQEYQTYADFKHSKGRTVTTMMFHPVLEDVVVMATAVDLTWERRIDAHSKSLMEPNYVLFWDLRDSAHPQIMLDAPADVFSVNVNPSDPHLVCGGCANGQIAFWDLGRTYFELRAKIQDRGNLSAADAKTKRPSFLDKLKDSAESLACPLIPIAGLSNLDMSHKRAVSSVSWIPPHIEIGKNGMVYDNLIGRSVQFMSVAGDGTLRLWDIRPQKKPGQAEEDDEDLNKDVIKVNKWAHLENNQWKYHFRYSMEDNSGGPMFATTIRICEKRPEGKDPKEEVPAIQKSSIDDDSNENPEALDDPKPVAPKPKRVGALVQNLSALTTIFIGTEAGAIGLVDWLRNKEGVISPDFGNKIITNVYLSTFHHGAITSITKSPFYPELLLVVGGGTISIWKETCPYPIFCSGGFDVFPWCAIWSNSRPAVFYVGNREGSVSIWDLMDRSNGPVMTQPITNVRITGIGIPKIAASASKNQYLAVTDSDGVVLVLLLPRFYARPLPNEDHVVRELMNREDSRMTAWVKEMEERSDKIQSVNYSWQQSRVTKTPEETNREEIEQEGRLNEEYQHFVEFEMSIIGDLKEGEPELPTMDTQISDEFDAMILDAQRLEAEEEGEEEDDDSPDDDYDDYNAFDDDDDDDYDQFRYK